MIVLNLTHVERICDSLTLIAAWIASQDQPQLNELESLVLLDISRVFGIDSEGLAEVLEEIELDRYAAEFPADIQPAVVQWVEAMRTDPTRLSAHQHLHKALMSAGEHYAELNIDAAVDPIVSALFRVLTAEARNPALVKNGAQCAH
jgi:hypothetical protein